MQKINFQNLPSTTTPVNATNLNQMQTNTENAIDGTQLYYSSTGTSATLTMSDSSANYNYIEILFEAEDVYNSTKIYSPNGKYVYLSIDIVTNTNNYFKNSSWLISGNSISFQTANQYNISSTGVGNFVSSTNAVKIHRVVGYK